MKSAKMIRTAKSGYIITSIVLCLLGLIMIIFPGTSAFIIEKILGIAMIVFSIFKLFGYFSRDLFRLAFQYDFALGFFFLILGIIILAFPGSIFSFVSVIYGIVILADGLFKIQIADDSKRFGIRYWWIILVIAIISGILGILLIIRPGFGTQLIMVFFGISLIAEGLLNLIVAIQTVKVFKDNDKDIIDM